ncbi:mitogen-activated protein kinase 15-like [Thrips palmi]|uniref:Mitogen-activated protein kinase 15-like n=1 Tax=Thrips palmi TaxID=161013 RepID=A0A6P8ZKR5_THRPL|nr:mitogen-activated protein kinase 15-like [Thrips palmi]
MGSSSQVDDSITKKYDIKRRIGKGAYGIVWKAVDRSTNRPVAVKKIFDAFCNSTDAQRTFREIMFLQEFRNHPNVVKLLNIHRASNDKDIYLVFEFMETDLHKVIKRKHILQDLHKRFIMYQLLRATYYIHSGNVIHRDQKPSNILLDSYCRCKVADFGLARSLASDKGPGGTGPDGTTDPALTDYVATRWYRAPEILVASKQYTKGIDMWSLGCILAEMLLGKPLFPGTSTINQVEKIMATIDPPTPADLACVCPGYGSSLFTHPNVASQVSQSCGQPSPTPSGGSEGCGEAKGQAMASQGGGDGDPAATQHTKARKQHHGSVAKDIKDYKGGAGSGSSGSGGSAPLSTPPLRKP